MNILPIMTELSNNSRLTQEAHNIINALPDEQKRLMTNWILMAKHEQSIKATKAKNKFR